MISSNISVKNVSVSSDYHHQFYNNKKVKEIGFKTIKSFQNMMRIISKGCMLNVFFNFLAKRKKK